MINKKFMFPEPGNLLQYKQLYEMDKKAGKKEGLSGLTWEQNFKTKRECQKETRGNPPPDEGGREEETARNDQEGAGPSGEYN